MSTFDLVREFTNDELRTIYKEFKIMSRLHEPQKAKLSVALKNLFIAEKTPTNYWGDQYHMIKMALECQILDRFNKDLL